MAGLFDTHSLIYALIHLQWLSSWSSQYCCSKDSLTSYLIDFLWSSTDLMAELPNQLTAANCEFNQLGYMETTQVRFLRLVCRNHQSGSL